ncbi:MAG: hypothetical protein ABJB86_02045 [Bacteroidota bacterium]
MVEMDTQENGFTNVCRTLSFEGFAVQMNLNHPKNSAGWRNVSLVGNGPQHSTGWEKKSIKSSKYLPLKISVFAIPGFR